MIKVSNLNQKKVIFLCCILKNQIIKHKVGLLNLAKELQNVSKTCKFMGVSRDTFYRHQELAESGNVDALINKSRRVPNLKNRIDDAIEQAVLDFAIQYPAYGAKSITTWTSILISSGHFFLL